jgi:hypothetical protein
MDFWMLLFRMDEGFGMLLFRMGALGCTQGSGFYAFTIRIRISIGRDMLGMAYLLLSNQNEYLCLYTFRGRAVMFASDEADKAGEIRSTDHI